jgi:hypothetical protein
MMHFINKLINPVLTLKTEEEVEAFLNLDQEVREQTKFLETNPLPLGDIYLKRRTKTRVLALVFDPEDFTDEISTLKQASRNSAKRDELRVALVTDKKIVKKYKANYGTLWFPEGAYSALVIKRYDGKYFSHDLLEGSPTGGYQFWMNK